MRDSVLDNIDTTISNGLQRVETSVDSLVDVCHSIDSKLKMLIELIATVIVYKYPESRKLIESTLGLEKV